MISTTASGRKVGRVFSAVGALLLAFIAAGCTSNILKQPAPAKAYFAIEPGAPNVSFDAAVPAQHAGAPVLQVRSLRVSPPYDGVAFVYRTGPAQYDNDYYNQFIAAPGAMLSGELVDWLSKTAPLPVLASGVGVHSDLVLDGEVTKLLVDFSDKASPRAVLNARFFLTRSNVQSGDVFILLDKTYEQAVPVMNESPAACAAAWGQAYGQILQSLSGDLRPLLLRQK